MAARLNRYLTLVASVALLVMMLVVVADVALRYAFNTPVRGAYDVVSAGLLVMVFFGMGPVIHQGREIVIDLFDSRLPPFGLHLLRVTAAIAAVGVILFIGWSMLGPARDAWRYGDRSLELNLPLWVFWALAFVGLFGATALALVSLGSLLGKAPARSAGDVE